MNESVCFTCESKLNAIVITVETFAVVIQCDQRRHSVYYVVMHKVSLHVEAIDKRHTIDTIQGVQH